MSEQFDKQHAKWRKKPVVVEAVMWIGHGDHPLVERPWSKKSDYRCPKCGDAWGAHGVIKTLEDTQDGGHFVCPGDWIIKGVKGEHYACKDDFFRETYEPADSEYTGDSESTSPETPGSWEERCAVLYQVIGCLSSCAGIFESSNDVADALDVAAGRGDVEKLLPWPKDTKLFQELEARVSVASATALGFDQVRDAIVTRMSGHTIPSYYGAAWKNFIGLLQQVKREECAIAPEAKERK